MGFVCFKWWKIRYGVEIAWHSNFLAQWLPPILYVDASVLNSRAEQSRERLNMVLITHVLPNGRKSQWCSCSLTALVSHHDVLLCFNIRNNYNIKTVKEKWTLNVMFLSTVNWIGWLTPCSWQWHAAALREHVSITEHMSQHSQLI